MSTETAEAPKKENAKTGYSDKEYHSLVTYHALFQIASSHMAVVNDADMQIERYWLRKRLKDGNRAQRRSAEKQGSLRVLQVERNLEKKLKSLTGPVEIFLDKLDETEGAVEEFGGYSNFLNDVLTQASYVPPKDRFKMVQIMSMARQGMFDEAFQAIVDKSKSDEEE